MNVQIISPAELTELRKSRPDLVLLDVRLAEDFTAEHLRGATNNCVFEVQFLDRMKEIAPDLLVPVCCYGCGQGSLESSVAAEKLRRGGYSSVYDLASGLAACTEVGWSTECVGTLRATPALHDGTYDVDLSESWVEWTGRNLLNSHYGRIGLRRGEISVRDGRLAGGEFVLEMAEITCHDLAGTPLHDVLVAHLRSDDFFDTGQFPTARFVLSATSSPAEATPGSRNLPISGELTMKDISAPLQLFASAGVAPDGRLAAQAEFELDRTRWNVLYGSGKFFRRLGGHLVNDCISIRLRIVASPVRDRR